MLCECFRRIVFPVACVLVGLLLSACGGGSSGSSGQPSFVLGGTVTGLASGAQILLLSGAGTQTTVRANGNFEFADRLKAGTGYAVTINKQPIGQTCTLSPASGSIGSPGSDIRNLTIVCVTNPYQLSGTVSGLRAGVSLELTDGVADGSVASLSANGTFSFSNRYVGGTRFAVTVVTQPTGQDCRVSNGTGTFASASINTIQVACTPLTPSVGGTLSGLSSGQQVVLTNNGADRLVLNADGAFQFPAPIAFSGSYSVAIASQPERQVCSIAEASAAQVVSNIQSVRVTCGARTYSVGGSVVGLNSVSGPQGLALTNNGRDSVGISASGAFSFPTPLPGGSPYSVTIASQPSGQTCTVVGGAGRVDVADIRSIAVQCVAGAWRSRVLAGSGLGRTTDGIGSTAEFSSPAGVVLLPSGWFLVSEISGSVLRRVNPSNGQTVTYSGSMLPGYADSTVTRNAAYRAPQGVAVDRAGNVYVADTGNHVIRRIDAFSGEVSTWAGIGQAGWADGPGLAARFNSPSAVATDAAGNVYVADTGNHVIRRIAVDRSVSTLAGSAGQAGFVDGTSGAVRFYAPSGVAVDASGQIYVADSVNGAIRMVSQSGQVVTLAGNGTPGDADGTGSGARFSIPQGILVDAQYTVYVADSGNHRVRLLQVVGGVGVVQTLAGSGVAGDMDGESLSIGLRQPFGLALTPSGDLIVSEAGGHKIRVLSRMVSR